MAVFKCKMCGGSLDVAADSSIATCEYCGSVQTLPNKNNEVIANLFNRANNLRLKCEFDKAAEVYERILNENNNDAEAHWGLVLCKYGIEYVEDPKTGKRIPTCHRTLYDSVLSDIDCLSALANSDGVSKDIYKTQADEIAALQKDILAIVKNEKPFDVFICYKETDENGRRTVDSALANDIYYQLTQEGLKVFYAAITLEDKLGIEYEPYIFAALNSAKVMLVVGTKPENFESVWVRNEWSRYLKLMKADRSKLLIPCYRDMDAYDLPDEFSHLQAQDMSKIGFVNDVVRGIKKIIRPDEQKATPIVQQTTVVETAAVSVNTESLLKRAFIFLEDGDWASANEYCEKVLDLEPENGEAYLGKLMAELQVKTRSDLANCANPFDENNYYIKAMRFGDDKLKAELEGYISHINERNEFNRLAGIYNHALTLMSGATNEFGFKQAAEEFKAIKEFKNSAELAEKCLEKAEEAKKNNILSIAKNNMQYLSADYYEEAIELLKSIPGWKDADELVIKCEETLSKIKAKAEADRIERERQAELRRIAAAKKRKQIIKFTAISLAAIIAVVVLVITVIIPAANYSKAGKFAEKGEYANAAIYYGKAGNFIDAKEKSFDLWDKVAVRETIAAGDYHTIALKSDGTVVAVGDNGDGQCDVSGWKDIVAVTAGTYHTVGLKSDGTVVAVGYNGYGQCDVSDWKDIVAVSACDNHTVALKADGTVVAVGNNVSGQCDVSDWEDIVAISAGWGYTVGLKVDGTVVAVGYNGFGQCDVSDWKDIVAVTAGAYHTIGLKSDGTVVAVGSNYDGRCDVSDWKDIVAVTAGTYHTVGLKSDGTVVAVGNNYSGRCDVSDWTDIVAVSAGDYHTVGLKSDGTVVAVGNNNCGRCDVSGWKNIKQPN